jgi:hypothetical protein
VLALRLKPCDWDSVSREDRDRDEKEGETERGEVSRRFRSPVEL